MAFKTLAAMGLATTLLTGTMPVLNPGTPANSSAVYRLYPELPPKIYLQNKTIQRNAFQKVNMMNFKLGRATFSQ